jgi:hypothetical protein
MKDLHNRYLQKLYKNNPLRKKVIFVESLEEFEDYKEKINGNKTKNNKK